jgi:hypothetical protein
MATALTRESHEAGYQASAATLKGREDSIDVMQLVPLRQGLQQSKTAEELLGYVNSASIALLPNPLLKRAAAASLKDLMGAYLDGAYKNLGIANPLKGRGA